MSEKPAQYDQPWKQGIEWYFSQFLEFGFPVIHNSIDWSKGFQILEQELQEIVGESASEKVYADKLFQVYLLEGKEVWILIHIEIQSQPDQDFGKRMYQYNYRAFDRYEKPVISLALLGDENRSWRPSSYSYGIGNCQSRVDFEVMKILDYQERWESLEASVNPIAIMIMAHLKTQSTKSNLGERQKGKWILVRSLFEKGYTKEDVVQLFRIIDKMMTLSSRLQQKFKKQVKQYQEERKMPFLSTIEEEAMATGIQQGVQQGIQQGVQQGIQQGIRENILNILTMKFGELPSEIEDKIGTISDKARLNQLLLSAVNINSIQEFQELLS
jgi:hypothetical protein